MASPLLSYPHRHNFNGTYDSICLICFATVATTKTEPELAVYDRRHICDDLLLAERHLFKPPHSSWPESTDVLTLANHRTTKIAARESPKTLSNEVADNPGNQQT
jgi:hypothetical protein